MIYLTRLADVLGIDLVEAALDKLEESARRYPVEQAHGSAAKRRAVSRPSHGASLISSLQSMTLNAVTTGFRRCWICPPSARSLRAARGQVYVSVPHVRGGLLRLATTGNLADRIVEQSYERAWRRSGRASFVGAQPGGAGAGLVRRRLGQVEMLVEYQLPLTSKRVDVVLAGVHPRTGEDSYVVVELKQWSYAEPYEDSDTPRRGRARARPAAAPGRAGRAATAST